MDHTEKPSGDTTQLIDKAADLLGTDLKKKLEAHREALTPILKELENASVQSSLAGGTDFIIKSLGELSISIINLRKIVAEVAISTAKGIEDLHNRLSVVESNYQPKEQLTDTERLERLMSRPATI